jgi:hypothetical protein
MLDGAASMDDILNLIEKELGYDARFNVVPALGFLFLLRKARYAANSDAIVYEKAEVGASS